MFGAERVQWFNGGLFDNAVVLRLTAPEIGTLVDVGKLDWSRIEPAIFGTLFERGLDPAQRAQLGAHYTGRDDIWRLVEPVIIRPLRREFAAMQARVTELTMRRDAARKKGTNPEARRLFDAYLERLRGVRILDPACGSGNFLYVALQALKDLELEAIGWGSFQLREPQQFPRVGPEAVMGIEINAYAAELARVTIWIGEIQWMLNHGFHYRSDPVLQPLDTIECRDALIDWTNPTAPCEAEWPAAEFIVGNPPFLGGKFMRRGLGDDYVDTLFGVFDRDVPREADFVTYWHEKARAAIEIGRSRRAGLLANQSIRSGASRRVLERIKQTGGIFYGRADEPWVLAGASVHISFVGQDDGSDVERSLDGHAVAEINADLTTGLDLTRARRLRDNLGLAFMGDTKGGPFEIDGGTAAALLGAPNPDGRSNSKVIRPWVNGDDINGRPLGRWIIDFPFGMSEGEAAMYEAPFEYALRVVKQVRSGYRSTIDEWWLHERPRGDMRAALADLTRCVVTTRLSPHRLFAWLPTDVLPDSRLIAFARDDDFFFGILHSRLHDLWSRRTAGAQRREAVSGLTYTPTTCFETFPFPPPTDEQREAIAAAARRLVELRDGWLNPPGLTESELTKRTLTNLYNQRPTWLANAHATLDAVVLAAYGWPADLPDDEILAALLALNFEREPAPQKRTPR